MNARDSVGIRPHRADLRWAILGPHLWVRISGSASPAALPNDPKPPSAGVRSRARSCSKTCARGGGRTPVRPVGTKPHRSYRRTASRLASTTSRNSRACPRDRASAATCSTSVRPMPRPRCSGATHMLNRPATPSRSEKRASPASAPSATARKKTVPGSSRRSRQRASGNAHSCSKVDPNASGSAASARSRTRRSRCQSSGEARSILADAESCFAVTCAPFRAEGGVRAVYRAAKAARSVRGAAGGGRRRGGVRRTRARGRAAWRGRRTASPAPGGRLGAGRRSRGRRRKRS